MGSAGADRRQTPPDIKARKRSGTPITMVTAYDYPTAMIVDRAGIDVILVGDSLANVVLGLETTLPVTVDEMLYHTRAVVRGRQRTLVVGDMPFLSYNITPAEAIRNAGRFLKEAGADAVKLEGGLEVAETVKAIVDAGIPVMGHLGLTPQTVSKLGGYRVQGREADSARGLVEGAEALEASGVFAIVLECVPDRVAGVIRGRVEVPTIGIGAGADCDGQVLVFHDLLGLNPGRIPRFVRRYAELGAVAQEALVRFRDEVTRGVFPGADHAFSIEDEEYVKLVKASGEPTR